MTTAIVISSVCIVLSLIISAATKDDEERSFRDVCLKIGRKKKNENKRNDGSETDINSSELLP